MLWQKILTLLIIALGESLMIAAQVYGSKAVSSGVNFWDVFKPSNWYFWVSIVGVFTVLIGYFYGIKVFNNIWLVTLTSWTALVVAEIILAQMVFKTIPEGNVLIGFVLVLIGFIVSNL
jgi:flagellar biosynthesis protein FliP